MQRRSDKAMLVMASVMIITILWYANPLNWILRNRHSPFEWMMGGKG